MTKCEDLSKVFFDICLSKYKLSLNSYRLFPRFINIFEFIQNNEKIIHKTPYLLTNTNHFFTFLISYIHNEDNTSYDIIMKMGNTEQITLSEKQLTLIINWFSVNDNINEDIKQLFSGLDVENLYNLGILINNTLGRIYDIKYLIDKIKDLISSRSSSPSNKLRPMNLMSFGINAIMCLNIKDEDLIKMGIPKNIYSYCKKTDRVLSQLDKLSDLLVGPE